MPPQVKFPWEFLPGVPQIYSQERSLSEEQSRDNGPLHESEGLRARALRGFLKHQQAYEKSLEQEEILASWEDRILDEENDLLRPPYKKWPGVFAR